MKALLNAFSQMVSIISMNVNKTKLPATKGFTIVHCRLWNMVHGSNLNWNRCMHNDDISQSTHYKLRCQVHTYSNSITDEAKLTIHSASLKNYSLSSTLTSRRIKVLKSRVTKLQRPVEVLFFNEKNMNQVNNKQSFFID